MASQNSDSSSGPPDRITFDVERLGVDDPGQVVISGRWSGVRGRRFMRPALVVQRRSDGSEQRSLAELEHKPWAAEDGELWTAAFPLDIELGDAASGRNLYYRLSESAFHTLLIHTDFLVVHEVTNGPFIRDKTVLATFAPPEDRLAEARAYVQQVAGRVTEFRRTAKNA